MKFIVMEDNCFHIQKFKCQKLIYKKHKYQILHKLFVLLCTIFLCVNPSSSVAEKPDLFLLRTYQKSKDVTDWVMSEKLDGMRAYWNGHQLVSRGGKIINAPEWFIRNFPPFELDGELWTKRNDFENIVSIVRRQQPDDRWSQITYRIFEVPKQTGGLLDRLSVLQLYLKERSQSSDQENLSHLLIIPQIKIKNQQHLDAFFQHVLSQGGEGVVIRDPVAIYQTGRLKNALKRKSYQDAECEVAGYQPGRGKYQGQVGALKCRLKNQSVIRIGSGLSDQQRKQPPAIGSVITFKYYGLTAKGLPRFPVFLRHRVFAAEDK